MTKFLQKIVGEKFSNFHTTVWKFENFSPTIFLQKFRQSNFFTKELYCKSISRKFFEVGVNFWHYHTEILDQFFIKRIYPLCYFKSSIVHFFCVTLYVRLGGLDILRWNPCGPWSLRRVGIVSSFVVVCNNLLLKWAKRKLLCSKGS